MRSIARRYLLVTKALSDGPLSFGFGEDILYIGSIDEQWDAAMSYLTKISLFLAIAFVSGCSIAPAVFTDFDAEQSFDGYKSFAWIGDDPMIVSGDIAPNPLVAKGLKNAVKETLQSKGFQFVDDASDADFVVAYTVGARDKIEVREREVIEYYSPTWRWGYQYVGVAYPLGFPRTEVTTREYTEGSLAIDIFDTERKSPVWHGSASKRLSRSELRGNSAETTRSAVETILAGFPPQ